ncbi:hypothetical protein MKW94_026595 [Papaver nudicaule]|uniref:Fe2OG dioxygenase domain-containing protein n=1 Tax=Papaver nudicaule TaxID=74823 RepID=A0AA41VGV9_PAPNU|nr:hypothetical protein [Papaver nudicaule]
MGCKVMETNREDDIISSSECMKYNKGVKHLCETGIANVPKKYIFPVSQRNDENEVVLSLKLPTIDFAELQGPNRHNVLDSLSEACENYGFFQVINHGISNDTIENMIDVSRRFFQQPMEERSKYMSNDVRAPVRYGTSFNQSKDSVFCWRDFLKLNCHSMEDSLPHWPTSPADFRDSLFEYTKQNKYLFLKIMEAIVETLGIVQTTGENESDENDNVLKDFVSKEFENGSHLMVINCYPACPQPELTLGIPPHSDYGFLTLLLQDEVEGLQIQHEGQWLTVEPNPNSFVVNVGDHLEIFSNGRYKSVLHRAVVNAERSRTSVASLHSMPVTNMVRPSPTLIDEDNPRRYLDTDFATFVDFISTRELKEKDFLDSRKC